MSTIYSLVKTKQNAVNYIKILDNVLEYSYLNKPIDFLLKQLPFNLSNNNLVISECEELKKALKDASVVNISICIDPDNTFIDQLYKWFNENGFKNFLLDISIDSSIYGGIQLSYNGKFLDLSIKQKVIKYVK